MRKGLSRNVSEDPYDSNEVLLLTLSRNASFEPGGELLDPIVSSTPLLHLQIKPRLNLYIPSDTYASFIIDAPISYNIGSPFSNTSFNPGTNISDAFTTLFIDVSVVASGLDLVSSRNVSVNSTANEFVFALSSLEPRTEPYDIVVTGVNGDGSQSYTATTELFYLPTRTDGGSVVKLDNLYGGLLVQDYVSNSTDWTPLFP